MGDAVTARSFQPRKILVPTDFSEASRCALPFAVSLARQFRASLLVAYVVPAMLPGELTHLGIVFEEVRLTKQAEEALRQWRERELPADLPVETLVLCGGPPHELARAAQDRGCDLIVLSTHGYTGWKHIALGGTAERVVRFAPCPVLVVRADSPPPANPGEFKHLLLPTDFSKASQGALQLAAAFTREFGADATLLHVVESPNYPTWGYVNLAIRDEQLTREALERLEGMRGHFDREAGARILVRTGNAPYTIAEVAREQKQDLILISMHGHTGLARVLLGSVTERVVRLAPCPVLVGHWHV
ncbi:MAG: universal stress protein [Verrucomicrobiota bacterium]